MRITAFFALFIFLTHSSGYGQVDDENERFRKVDTLVSSVNRQAVFHPQLLAKLLTDNLTNDYDKVRAFYVWIAQNIQYDMLAYTYDRTGGQSVNQVLRSGKALCTGYSLLFDYFCEQANIESEIIEGYAKGYGYRKKQRFKSSNHAWNAVNIYGTWYLLDVTWASGSPINPDRKRNKADLELWFLADPAEFVNTHLPEDPSWQLLKQKVSLADFETGLPNDSATSHLTTYTPYDYSHLNEYDRDLLKYQRAAAFNPSNAQLKERLCFAYIYKGISITDDIWRWDYAQLSETVTRLDSQFHQQMDSALLVVQKNEGSFTTRQRQIITDEINYQKGVFNYEIGTELFRKYQQQHGRSTGRQLTTEKYYSEAESHFELVPQSSIYRRDANEYLANIREFRSRNPTRTNSN